MTQAHHRMFPACNMVEKMVFAKKEIREYYRSGRLFIFGIVALLFGIMNPAIAKLTPWLLETLSDSMKDAGMTVTSVTVDASACWQQYYKNIPLLIIIFMIFSAGSFSKEYSKGTLLLVITKGYPRKKIYVAKACIMTCCYTLVSLIYYQTTMLYSSFYWDNSILSHIFTGALFYYVFGLLIIALILFFSSFVNEVTGIIGGVAGSVMVMYLLGMVPKLKKYLPVNLTGGETLLKNQNTVSYFTPSLIITLCLTVVLMISGGILFGKKKM